MCRGGDRELAPWRVWPVAGLDEGLALCGLEKGLSPSLASRPTEDRRRVVASSWPEEGRSVGEGTPDLNPPPSNAPPNPGVWGGSRLEAARALAALSSASIRESGSLISISDMGDEGSPGTAAKVLLRMSSKRSAGGEPPP